MHDAIVTVQVTLAVLLVVGATLLIRTVERGSATSIRLRCAGRDDLQPGPAIRHAGGGDQPILPRRASRVAALPGVTHAGMTNRLPLRDLGYQLTVNVEDRPDLAGAKRPNSLYRTASPDFSARWGCVSSPSAASSSTDAGGPPVVASSTRHSLAAHVANRHSAIGKHITEHWGKEPVTRTVVGVVRETHMTSLIAESPFTMWIPLEQAPVRQGGVLVVRSAAPSAVEMPLISPRDRRAA